MNVDQKLMTRHVDMQTAHNFRISKKLKLWLRYHPNFIRVESGKYVHVYEPEFRTLQVEMNEQRNRDDVQQSGSEVDSEEFASDRDDVQGGAEGEEV